MGEVCRLQVRCELTARKEVGVKHSAAHDAKRNAATSGAKEGPYRVDLWIRWEENYTKMEALRYQKLCFTHARSLATKGDKRARCAPAFLVPFGHQLWSKTGRNPVKKAYGKSLEILFRKKRNFMPKGSLK